MLLKPYVKSFIEIYFETLAKHSKSHLATPIPISAKFDVIIHPVRLDCLPFIQNANMASDKLRNSAEERAVKKQKKKALEEAAATDELMNGDASASKKEKKDKKKRKADDSVTEVAAAADAAPDAAAADAAPAAKKAKKEKDSSKDKKKDKKAAAGSGSEGEDAAAASGAAAPAAKDPAALDNFPQLSDNIKSLLRSKVGLLAAFKGARPGQHARRCAVRAAGWRARCATHTGISRTGGGDKTGQHQRRRPPRRALRASGVRCGRAAAASAA
jgi:hypothetical protein